MARVLVTGGAGFIGSHVVDALVERGDDVVVLDLLHPAAHAGRPDYLNPAATYIWGDLADRSVVERTLGGVDAVCHQASMVGLGADFGDVEAYVRHNDLATAAMLHAMHHRGFAGRLVVASSMVVYGEGAYRCPSEGLVRPPPRAVPDLRRGSFEPRCPRCGAGLIAEAVTEDAPLEPRTVYAATKAHQEHLCFAFGRATGVPVVALRYHNVYGPRMPRDTPYAGVAAIFRSAMESGRPANVFEDGRQQRDFIHVGDVARANLLALNAESTRSAAFNIATGKPHTVGEMADAMWETFDQDAPPPVVTGGFRAADVRHIFASPSRARRELGFAAEVTFDEGMRELARASQRSPVRRAALRGPVRA